MNRAMQGERAPVVNYAAPPETSGSESWWELVVTVSRPLALGAIVLLVFWLVGWLAGD